MPDPSLTMPTRRHVLRLTVAAGACVAIGGSVTAGLLRLARTKRIASTRTYMGTRVTVTVLHQDESLGRKLVSAAFVEIGRLEPIFSRHQPNGVVSRLNRTGRLRGAPNELLEVLRASHRYSELTKGAFDPTIAPLLQLYETTSARAGVVPDGAKIAGLLELVDYRALRISGDDVHFDAPGMAVTLDGIAKGYIVDRVTDLLVEGGAGEVMVEAGGDVGSSAAGVLTDGWRLAVQDPREARGVLGVVRVRDEAVATSGDYMQAFTDDLTSHHILDPRTGHSPEHTAGVTVVAPTAMEADALSTAVFVLGPEFGVKLLEELDGREGLVVTKRRESVTTTGFARYLA